MEKVIFPHNQSRLTHTESIFCVKTANSVTPDTMFVVDYFR